MEIQLVRVLCKTHIERTANISANQNCIIAEKEKIIFKTFDVLLQRIISFSLRLFLNCFCFWQTNIWQWHRLIVLTLKIELKMKGRRHYRRHSTARCWNLFCNTWPPRKPTSHLESLLTHTWHSNEKSVFFQMWSTKMTLPSPPLPPQISTGINFYIWPI